MHEEVAKPLIQEVKIVQQLNERYRADAEKSQSDLKVLNAIIRLPVMSDMFHKAVKRKEARAVSRQIEKAAIEVLDKHVSRTSPERFFNNLVNHLD